MYNNYRSLLKIQIKRISDLIFIKIQLWGEYLKFLFYRILFSTYLMSHYIYFDVQKQAKAKLAVPSDTLNTLRIE